MLETLESQWSAICLASDFRTVRCIISERGNRCFRLLSLFQHSPIPLFHGMTVLFFLAPTSG